VSGQINLSSSLEEKEFGDEEGKSALNDGVHFEMKQTFVLVLKLPSFQECFQAAVLSLFHLTHSSCDSNKFLSENCILKTEKIKVKLVLTGIWSMSTVELETVKDSYKVLNLQSRLQLILISSCSLRTRYCHYSGFSQTTQK